MLDSVIEWISVNIPAWVWIALFSHLAILGAVAYLILLERKTASWVQDRIGPNRVGLGGLLSLVLLPLAPVIDIEKIASKARGFHMFGLGQPLADGLKFILKEDYRPKHVDKWLFSLAPMIMIIPVIVSIAVLPWGGYKQSEKTVDVTGVNAKDAAAVKAKATESLPINAKITAVGTPVDMGTKYENTVGSTSAQTVVDVTYRWGFQAANLNVGVLFVLAILSLAVYGVVIGGWASNNKYSFLGGLRATANMISYEIPLGIAVLCIVVMYGTLELDKIVAYQAHYWVGFIPAWNVFTQPLAFMMFLICIHAEANRAPFDLAEAEQELVGGYHTEYSAMRFALFFLAEYAGMITTSAVCVALFFGGWHFPGLTGSVVPGEPDVTDSLLICLLRAGVFFGKTLVIIFVFMWVRWSLPRFRFDQLMMLAWRALIPISLGLLVMTAFLVYFTKGQGIRGLNGEHALIFFGANVAMTIIMLAVSRMLPAPPETNRRIAIPGSRYTKTPVPATA